MTDFPNNDLLGQRMETSADNIIPGIIYPVYNTIDYAKQVRHKRMCTISFGR